MFGGCWLEKWTQLVCRDVCAWEGLLGTSTKAWKSEITTAVRWRHVGHRMSTAVLAIPSMPFLLKKPTKLCMERKGGILLQERGEPCRRNVGLCRGS